MSAIISLTCSKIKVPTFYLNTDNGRASVKLSLFHALILMVLCKTTVHSQSVASCMTNLSEFHFVFSSHALICLNKEAFEGHLCQTVNNFVKHN